MSRDTYKQATRLLELVTSGTRRCARTAALFMDELAAVVAQGQVHTTVEVPEIRLGGGFFVK